MASYSVNYSVRPVTPDWPSPFRLAYASLPPALLCGQAIPRWLKSRLFPSSKHRLRDLNFPGPSIWGEAAEDVLRKASAAYHIVYTYAEASAGGQRWSDEDTVHIVQVGRDNNIISEVERLRRWRDELARRAPKDVEMEQMLSEVADVKVSCEKVLTLINKRERLPICPR